MNTSSNNDVTSDPIVAFYLGRSKTDDGRWLKDIWTWDNDKLEWTHNYIQWLFPLREKSKFNTGAPTLTSKTIEAFLKNDDLKRQMIVSLKIMLKFYGLQSFASENGSIKILETPEFNARRLVWLTPGNHNFLRITRILRSLQILGLSNWACALFACLSEIYNRNSSIIGAETFGYWKAAYMSHGLASQGSVNASIKKMPDDLNPLPLKSTTGMWSEHVYAHDPSDVLHYLHSLDYGKHVDNLYDCEDRAFWGIAHARSRFPGQPMAVAIGNVVGGPFDGQNHAVIAFWAKDKGLYKNFYFDPEGKVSWVPKVKGGLVNFDTKILIPYPVYRPNSGSGKQRDLPPFDQFTWKSGAVILDRSYKLFDASSIKKMMDFLRNKRYGITEIPIDSNLSSLFSSLWENSIEDRVLWAFAHARREFIGYAIGMAFGTIVKNRSDYASLVLWDNQGEPILMDIEFGRVIPEDFKVRTLIL